MSLQLPPQGSKLMLDFKMDVFAGLYEFSNLMDAQKKEPPTSRISVKLFTLCILDSQTRTDVNDQKTKHRDMN